MILVSPVPSASTPLPEDPAMDDIAFFTADWLEVAFIHFALDPAVLQREVPFALDLYEGRAWVSVVTFTQHRLRLRFGEELTALLTAPIATHAFCNLRTYVRHRGEAGIHFLAEWIPNALARFLGPLTYGLPYRAGTLELLHDARLGRAAGTVVGDGDRRLTYTALATPAYEPVTGPLDAFLVERYTGFTAGRGRRCFHICHPPWELARGTVDLVERELIDQALPALRGVLPSRCHIGPGVRDVIIGAPMGAARAGRRTDRRQPL